MGSANLIELMDLESKYRDQAARATTDAERDKFEILANETNRKVMSFIKTINTERLNEEDRKNFNDTLEAVSLMDKRVAENLGEIVSEIEDIKAEAVKASEPAPTTPVVPINPYTEQPIAGFEYAPVSEPVEVIPSVEQSVEEGKSR